MNKPAQIYAWTVAALGFVTLVTALSTWRSQDPATAIACLALAAVASTFKIKLPGLTSTISPSFVFVLVAAGQLSFAETVFIGAVGAIVQSLWRPKTRPKALQVAFNCATITIASGFAYGVTHGLPLYASFSTSSGIPLMISGLVLLIANSLLVAVILCLIQKLPLRNSWQSIQVWAVPYYLSGGVLAQLWCQVPLGASLSFVVLAAISAYLLTSSYRGIVGMLHIQEAI